MVTFPQARHLLSSQGSMRDKRPLGLCCVRLFRALLTPGLSTQRRSFTSSWQVCDSSESPATAFHAWQLPLSENIQFAPFSALHACRPPPLPRRRARRSYSAPLAPPGLSCGWVVPLCGWVVNPTHTQNGALWVGGWTHPAQKSTWVGGWFGMFSLGPPGGPP